MSESFDTVRRASLTYIEQNFDAQAPREIVDTAIRTCTTTDEARRVIQEKMAKLRDDLTKSCEIYITRFHSDVVGDPSSLASEAAKIYLNDYDAKEWIDSTVDEDRLNAEREKQNVK